MYDTIVWEGEQISYYRAWLKMFEDCKYPDNERFVSKALDAGLWIEKD